MKGRCTTAALFLCPKGSPITGTWSTQWRGDTYTLTPSGQLLKEATMPRSITTASLVEQAKQDLLAPSIPTITRIIAEEQAALEQRRAAHYRAQQESNRD